MKKLLLLIILFTAIQLQAQDRLFTYTYQSNVLNKGNKELEIWTTMHNSRNSFYRAFDHRVEFEIGMGSKLQTAFYLNYSYSKEIKTINGIDYLFDETEHSFANEWKLKLSDPVVNPFGTAFYFEYTLGTNEVELETKLIFDKQIGKMTHAFNLVGEMEFKKEFENVGNTIEIEDEKEFVIELNYGFAYKLNKNLSFGFELMNKNVHEDSQWQYSVLTAGPCMSYNFEGFWLNLSCMPQITDFKTSRLELNDNERIQTRLVFSYVF